MLRPRLAPIADAVPETVPFTGPEAIERRLGTPFQARLGANESPFGIAESTRQVIADAIDHSWKYGDPECHDLRVAIARHLGIAADEVVAGPGVDALLGLTVRLYAAPGDVVVTSLGGYPTFNYHLVGYGTRMVTAPYRDYHEDVDALARLARENDAAMVYLANPDNPMGSAWPAEAVERFIDSVPATTLIVLDEAYGELAPQGTMPPIDTSRPNLLRMRTFSKAYGMAGMRVGYAFGERQTIRAFERVRDHFGVSSVAQAGAIAALADTDHLNSVIAQTNAAKARIAGIAQDNGLHPLPSATNFVAIDCRSDAGFAQRILTGLAERGVFIRKPGTPGLDHCIRISAGLPAALDLLAEQLPLAIAAARTPPAG